MVKRCLLTGLVAGFLSISSTLYAGESEIILKDNTTASGLTVKEETANTTIARFRGDGKVGIGTTAPLASLNVRKDTSSAHSRILQLSNQTAGGWGSVGAGNISSIVWNDNTTASIVAGLGATYDGVSTVDLTIFGMYNAGFKDETTRLVTFKGNGNVGIGTTGPQDILHVRGAASPADAVRLQVNSAGYGQTGVRFDAWANNAPLAAIRAIDVGSWNGELMFFTDGGGTTGDSLVEHLRINKDGKVGIGTTAPSEKLEVSGNIKASGTVSQGSSRELKKNISYISTKEAMKALNGLKPVRFEYKADNFGEEHLGFIAEDVPELVAEQDRKHLNPMDLTAVFAKVIQEQQKMLQDQKETIDAMKREMEMMKSAMNYGAKGL